MNILGIDIAKKKFDVALMLKDKLKHKVFENNEKGFCLLKEWLDDKGIKELHACMEATNIYGEKLAIYLYKQGYKISVVNPARVKSFSQSNMSRKKTDEYDAKTIAYFCQALNPEAWFPTPEHIKTLQNLTKRYEQLLTLELQERNHLETASVEIKPSINKVIKALKNQVETIKEQINDLINNHPSLRDRKNLLSTIPGLGEVTICKVLAFLDQSKQFDSVKKMTSFIGLTPKNHRSGSSVSRKTTITKMGNSELRKSLYFPAMVAMRHNPIIKTFCDRLLAAGKCKMVVICAAMRKLIHIIYGVLKSGKPFNPNLCNVVMNV